MKSNLGERDLKEKPLRTIPATLLRHCAPPPPPNLIPRDPSASEHLHHCTPLHLTLMSPCCLHHLIQVLSLFRLSPYVSMFFFFVLIMHCVDVVLEFWFCVHMIFLVLCLIWIDMAPWRRKRNGCQKF